MFGLRSFLGYGFQVAKSLLGFGAKSAEDVLKGKAKKIFNVRMRSEIARNGGKPLDGSARKLLMEEAQELAEKSGAGILKTSFAVAGTGATVGAGGLLVDGAARGKDSALSHAAHNLFQAGKVPDAATDVQSFFERIREFIKQIAQFISNPMEYIFGDLRHKAQATAVVDGPESNHEQEGVIQATTDYATGLWNDATPSVSGVTNVLHAAAHGATQGVGLVGSFLYANSVGWATGETTNEVHENYVGSTIDTAWRSTTGLPDLNGHWAHAANTISSFAAPGGLALKAGLRLSRAFNMSNRFANAGIKLAPQMAAPTGP